MKKIFSLVFLSICFFYSCKKKEKDPVVCISSLFIAPCAVSERLFSANSKFCGSSNSIPQAKFIVDLSDKTNPNNIYEFGFNKYPSTGLYQMVTLIDTNNLSIPNQICITKDSGSFLLRSGYSAAAQIYVEHNNSNIIISYCDQSDGSTTFNTTLNCYVGTLPISDRIKVPY